MDTLSPFQRIFLAALCFLLGSGLTAQAKPDCPLETDTSAGSLLHQKYGGLDLGSGGGTVTLQGGARGGGMDEMVCRSVFELVKSVENIPVIAWTHATLPQPPQEPIYSGEAGEQSGRLSSVGGSSGRGVAKAGPGGSIKGGAVCVPLEQDEEEECDIDPAFRCQCDECHWAWVSTRGNSVGLATPPNTFVPPANAAVPHHAITHPEGGGYFVYTYHTPGNPPTSQGSITGEREIRYVDGTIERYTNTVVTFPEGQSVNRWRIVESIDPYDNRTLYRYASGKLSRIEYPDGLDEVYNYSPNWLASGRWSGGSYSGIEVTIVDRATATTIAGKARCYLFKKRSSFTQYGDVLSGTAEPFNGDLLYRIYFEKRDVLPELADPRASVLYDEATVQSLHQVVQYEYVLGTGLVESVSALFSDAVDSAVDTPAIPVISYEYNTWGGRARVSKETLHLEDGDEYTYTYTVHSAVVDEDGQSPVATRTRTGTSFLTPATEVHTLDTYGRVLSVATTPRQGVAVADRTQDSDYDTAFGTQPTQRVVTYEYGQGSCSCGGSPTAVILPGGRRTEYDYDPLSGLVTEVRAPNPDGSATVATTKFTWQPAVQGQVYGHYRLADWTDPAGRTWTVTYADEDREDTAWGVKHRTITTTSPVVNGSDISGGPVSFSSVQTFDVTDPALDASGAQTKLVGQLTQDVDAGGVVTKYHFDTYGRLQRAVANSGGGNAEIESQIALNRVGEVVSTTRDATSALPLTTTIDRDDFGRPTRVASIVSGVLHERKLFYDRWGHVAVVLSTNKTAAGNAPDDFHPQQPRTDVARAWLREEWHYRGPRLLVHLGDRRALDRNNSGAVADQADARFSRTDFTWTVDGWLQQVVSPNGALTTFTYDGFGSAFTATRAGGGASLLLWKRFVNASHEVVREFNGLGVPVVTATRNSAGFVTKVEEPATSGLPASYPWTDVPHAVVEYAYNVLGEVTETQWLDGSKTPAALLLRRTSLVDEVGRTYREDLYEGASQTADRTYLTAWTGASRLARETGPGGRFVEWSYDALGRVVEAKDSRAGNPNLSTYSYVPKTAFVQAVETKNWDEAGSPAAYVSRFVTYSRDNLGRVLVAQVGPVGNTLDHAYAYYTSGALESYTDPTGKVERFLPDAMGRRAERFMPGTQPVWNGAVYTDHLGGERSQVELIDGLGHVTKTIHDFAGRAVVLMEPGSSVEPTLANPHQLFSRFMEYDAASRLTRIHGADDVEIALHRDAIGRVLKRERVGQASAMVSSMWGRDNLRYDAFGQLVETNSFLGSGQEYVHEYFERDVLGRLLSESFDYVSGVNGPKVASEFTGGDWFRAGVSVENATASDSLAVGYSADSVGRVSSISWGVGIVGPTQKVSDVATTPLASYLHEGSAVRRRSTFLELGVAQPPSPFDTDYAYDTYGRMTSIGQSFSPVNALVQFGYDDASNLVREEYAKQGGQVGDRFAYDEHHRLEMAWMGSDSANMSDPATGTFVQKLTYGLDEVHNREAVQEQLGPSASATTTNYSLDSSSNRYDTVGGVGLLYDGRGSLAYHKDKSLMVVSDALDRVAEIYEVQTAAQQQAGGGAAAAANTTSFAITDMSALRMARTSIIQRLLNEEDVVDRASDAELVEARTEPLSSGAVESGGQDVVLVLKAWYLYDAMNRRVTRWVGDDATYFYAWDGWRQVQETAFRDQGGVFTAELKQFVWGEQLDELVAYRRSTDTGQSWQNYYIAEGGAHCPTRVLDEAGNVVEVQEYDPYGKTTFYVGGAAHVVSQIGNSFGWKCVHVDHETGWAYMRNRYYAPSLGRFTSRDPIGVDGDPVTWLNAYNYGSASPLMQSDRYGLQVIEAGLHLLGAGLVRKYGEGQASDFGEVIDGLARRFLDARARDIAEQERDWEDGRENRELVSFLVRTLPAMIKAREQEEFEQGCRDFAEMYFHPVNMLLLHGPRIPLFKGGGRTMRTNSRTLAVATSSGASRAVPVALLRMQDRLARGGKFAGKGEALGLSETRVAVFDTQTGLLHFGGSSGGGHLSVVQGAGLPVVSDRYVGGFLSSTSNGKLLFNPTSGTFPYTNPSLPSNALDLVRGTGVSVTGF